MNIYFSGSIYGGRQKLDAYKELIGALQNYGTVLNPEVADSEVIEKENGVLDEDIFNSLKDRLDTANVVFAEKIKLPLPGVICAGRGTIELKGDVKLSACKNTGNGESRMRMIKIYFFMMYVHWIYSLSRSGEKRTGSLYCS